MTERESAINRDLRALDDAHRLGRISRADYRGRRRRVLQTLSEGGGAVTARKTLVPPGVVTRPRSARVAATADVSAAGRAHVSLLSMRPGLAWKPWLVIAAGVLVLVAIICWALLRH